MEQPRLLAGAGDHTRHDTDLGAARSLAGHRPPAVVTAWHTQTSWTPFAFVSILPTPTMQPKAALGLRPNHLD